MVNEVIIVAHLEKAGVWRHKVLVFDKYPLAVIGVTGRHYLVWPQHTVACRSTVIVAVEHLIGNTPAFKVPPTVELKGELYGLFVHNDVKING